MKRTDLVKGLTILRALSRASMTECEMTMWEAMFIDREPDEFFAAIKRLAQEWIPTNAHPYPVPADIESRWPGKVDEMTAAETAWGHVLQSANYGPETYNPVGGTRPTGRDLAPDELSAIGGRSGLYRICCAENDPKELGYIQRDFMDAYKAYCRNVRAGLLPNGDRSKAALPAGTVDARAAIAEMRGLLSTKVN